MWPLSFLFVQIVKKSLGKIIDQLLRLLLPECTWKALCIIRVWAVLSWKDQTHPLPVLLIPRALPWKEGWCFIAHLFIQLMVTEYLLWARLCSQLILRSVDAKVQWRGDTYGPRRLGNQDRSPHDGSSCCLSRRLVEERSEMSPISAYVMWHLTAQPDQSCFI